MIIILMGVAGSGKTTVGQCLANALRWCFVEGDDLHPDSNVVKMSQGIPLTDRDRLPWLQDLRELMVELQGKDTSAIVTCSALKQSYREVLRPQSNESIQFVYLKCDAAALHDRLKQRSGHFMKADMLTSQLAILEEPEDAIVIEVGKAQTPEQIAADIVASLSLI